MIGTTGDPATPYEQAERLADSSVWACCSPGRARGTPPTRTNECVTEAVDAYLINLKVPPAGTECR